MDIESSKKGPVKWFLKYLRPELWHLKEIETFWTQSDRRSTVLLTEAQQLESDDRKLTRFRRYAELRKAKRLPYKDLVSSASFLTAVEKRHAVFCADISRQLKDDSLYLAEDTNQMSLGLYLSAGCLPAGSVWGLSRSSPQVEKWMMVRCGNVFCPWCWWRSLILRGRALTAPKGKRVKFASKSLLGYGFPEKVNVTRFICRGGVFLKNTDPRYFYSKVRQLVERQPYKGSEGRIMFGHEEFSRAAVFFFPYLHLTPGAERANRGAMISFVHDYPFLDYVRPGEFILPKELLADSIGFNHDIAVTRSSKVPAFEALYSLAMPFPVGIYGEICSAVLPLLKYFRGVYKYRQCTLIGESHDRGELPPQVECSSGVPVKIGERKDTVKLKKSTMKLRKEFRYVTDVKGGTERINISSIILMVRVEGEVPFSALWLDGGEVIAVKEDLNTLMTYDKHYSWYPEFVNLTMADGNKCAVSSGKVDLLMKVPGKDCGVELLLSNGDVIQVADSFYPVFRSLKGFFHSFLGTGEECGVNAFRVVSAVEVRKDPVALSLVFGNGKRVTTGAVKGWTREEEKENEGYGRFIAPVVSCIGGACPVNLNFVELAVSRFFTEVCLAGGSTIQIRDPLHTLVFGNESRFAHLTTVLGEDCAVNYNLINFLEEDTGPVPGTSICLRSGKTVQVKGELKRFEGERDHWKQVELQDGRKCVINLLSVLSSAVVAGNHPVLKVECTDLLFYGGKTLRVRGMPSIVLSYDSE